MRGAAVASIAALSLVALSAQTGFSPWRQPDGSNLSGFVLNCQDGTSRNAVPCGGAGMPLAVAPMPFVRAARNAFVLPATTTPQQFMIAQPPGSSTYRAYNPCVNADVRIMSVNALAPVVTVATSYPGVSKVTSSTEVIDRLSGTRFGRGPETLGSAANPLGGQSRIVSTMLVPIPGYTSDLSGAVCEFELMYGNNG